MKIKKEIRGRRGMKERERERGERERENETIKVTKKKMEK